MTPQTISPGKPRYSAHKVIPAGTDEKSSMTPSVLREALPVRTEQESPGKCVQVCDPYECISCGQRVCRRPMKPPLTTAPAPPTGTARQEKHAHAARHTIAEAITLKSDGPRRSAGHHDGPGSAGRQNRTVSNEPLSAGATRYPTQTVWNQTEGLPPIPPRPGTCRGRQSRPGGRQEAKEAASGRQVG